jgi:hypothetical protein
MVLRASLRMSSTCSPSLLILCMWYLSRVFKCFSFLQFLWFSLCLQCFHKSVLCWVCGLNILSCSYGLMSRMFSLYLVLNDRPLCTLYFNGQLIHFIWYTLLFSHLSVLVFDFSMFCTVLFLWRQYLYVYFWSLVIFLVSFPLYLIVAHFLYSCMPAFSFILWF